MDEVTLETNMTTLKEMVLDEERLITYVSLSKDLCVHVNDSKSLLNKFVENIRRKDSVNTINVSYLISGMTDDHKGRITVTEELNIADARKTFKSIFFEHVYSVSKCARIVDNVAFLAVSKFDDIPLCTGLIKSNSCIKRSSDEIGTLKSNSQSVHIEPKPSNPFVKKVKAEPKETVKNGHAEGKEVAKVYETKSEPTIKQEAPSPKKEQCNERPKQDVKRNGHKSQKGIAGFFNKSNSAPTKKTMVNIIKSKDDVKHEQSVKENSKDKPETEAENMEIDEEIENKHKNTVSKTETQNSKDVSKNKSLKQIKKNAKLDKKRKRVLLVSDSESDEEIDPFVDDSEHNIGNESEDEIPPTPAVKTVKITSGIVNPKKRRKIVDKTYTDEDGYILTKKEEVYESCSDKDEELPSKENIVKGNQMKVSSKKTEMSPKKTGLSPKKNESKVSKKKISPPQKGKQATLMNFFKKV